MNYAYTLDNTTCLGNGAEVTASNTAVIGNGDLMHLYLGSTSGNAKLNCTGIIVNSTSPNWGTSCGDITFDGLATHTISLDPALTGSGGNYLVIKAGNAGPASNWTGGKLILKGGLGNGGGPDGDIEINCGTGNLAIPDGNGLSYAPTNTGTVPKPIYVVNTVTATAGKITLGVAFNGTGSGVTIASGEYLTCDMSNSNINSSSVVLSSINCGGSGSEYLSLSGGGEVNGKYQFIIANNGSSTYNSSTTTNGVHLEISFLVIKPT